MQGGVAAQRVVPGAPLFFISLGELREGFLFLVEREVCILATAPWCAFAFTGHGPGCPMGL